MKRFASEIEEMLTSNKIFITPNGPIHTNNGTEFVRPIPGNHNRVEIPEETMDVDHNVSDGAVSNFLKKPGQVYYLYVDSNGKKYFSMISPEEWGRMPHKYVGSWKFEANSTWTKTTLES